MKIAIITRDEKLYSCKRLYETSIKQGHITKIINPDINLDFCNLYIKNNKKKYFDAVISRINPHNNIYGMSILKNLEINGSFVLNTSDSIIKAKNKIHSLQLISSKGIKIPNTGFCNSFENINHIINMVGGTPLIIKLSSGTQGIGVIIAESKQSAVSIIETFKSMNTTILVQEFIKECKGSDIRCLVINNKVVAAIKRTAKKGDFRSNLHRGGTAKEIKINKIEKNIAIQATKILGLKIAGVDILRSSRGPLISEVNASPGLEGIEKITRTDIAHLIIKFIEKTLRNN